MVLLVVIILLKFLDAVDISRIELDDMHDALCNENHHTGCDGSNLCAPRVPPERISQDKTHYHRQAKIENKLVLVELGRIQHCDERIGKNHRGHSCYDEHHQ